MSQLDFAFLWLSLVDYIIIHILNAIIFINDYQDNIILKKILIYEIDKNKLEIIFL